MDPEHKALKFWFKPSVKAGVTCVVCLKISGKYQWWLGHGECNFKIKEKLSKDSLKELEEDGCIIVDDVTENLLPKKDLVTLDEIYHNFQSKQLTKVNKDKLVSSANDHKKGSEILEYIESAIKQEANANKDQNDEDNSSSDNVVKPKTKVSKEVSSVSKSKQQESTKDKTKDQKDHKDHSKNKGKSDKNKKSESSEEENNSSRNSASEGSDSDSSNSKSSSSDADRKRNKNNKKDSKNKKDDNTKTKGKKSDTKTSSKDEGKSKGGKGSKGSNDSSEEADSVDDEKTHSAQSTERISASITRLDKIIKAIRNN